jgi:hypothetical protein
MDIHLKRSLVSVAAVVGVVVIAMTNIAARQGVSVPPQPATGISPALRYEKMLYLTGDQVMTVPSGYVWQVQSILSTDAALQEGGAGSFMSGFKNESEASSIARWQMRSQSMWVDGRFYHVAGFPLNLEAGTKVSASVNGRVLVVMQLKVG